MIIVYYLLFVDCCLLFAILMRLHVSLTRVFLCPAFFSYACLPLPHFSCFHLFIFCIHVPAPVAGISNIRHLAAHALA